MSTIDSTIGHLRPRPQRRRGSDYIELLTRVRQAGLLDRRAISYSVRIAINAVLVVAGWTVFVLLGDSWWQLVTAAYLAVVFTQTGASLRHARPIVRAYCLEHGPPYIETGLLHSYRQALRHPHNAGRNAQSVRGPGRDLSGPPDARVGLP